MGTSSEDVLLMVGHVRYKKNNGTLYLMAERIAWMLEGKDTFPVSHKYADVKMQKISPEGKPKVQLQVVLHNGEATTFHFVNPMGTEAQLEDRNGVKELLQQLLPKFKRSLNSELEEKNRILQEDPRLFELYRNLVVTKVTTPEEFWANHAPKRNSQGTTEASPSVSSPQDVGVSAAFLVDVKPQTDGSNGLKYNITADIIDSVFRTYPAVKKRHLENVPHKMSESEFWTRFFQSHYFHRDRLHTGTKDLFTECAKSDERDIREAITEGIRNPLIDISSFEDAAIFLEGAEPQENKGSWAGSTSTTNQSMIRRFNHHSMMVLKACKGAPSSSSSSAAAEAKTNSSPHANGISSVPNGLPKVGDRLCGDSGADLSEEVAAKRVCIREKVELEDLERERGASGVPVQLTRPDRYQHGPTPSSEAISLEADDALQPDASSWQLHQEIEAWNPSGTNVLTSSCALSALGELSPGGALMKNAQHIPIKDTVPEDVQRELRSTYVALQELLRHFWSCFPATTPQLEEKAVNMRSTLERFQYAKLQPFQDKLLREHHSPDLASHLNSMLQVAYNKFTTWQSKRMSLGLK